MADDDFQFRPAISIQNPQELASNLQSAVKKLHGHRYITETKLSSIEEQVNTIAWIILHQPEALGVLEVTKQLEPTQRSISSVKDSLDALQPKQESSKFLKIIQTILHLLLRLGCFVQSDKLLDRIQTLQQTLERFSTPMKIAEELLKQGRNQEALSLISTLADSNEKEVILIHLIQIGHQKVIVDFLQGEGKDMKESIFASLQENEKSGNANIRAAIQRLSPSQIEKDTQYAETIVRSGNLSEADQKALQITEKLCASGKPA